MMFKFSIAFGTDSGNEVLSTVATQVALILKGLSIMTTQAETILADIAAGKASSDAANAKCAELITLAHDIKAKLDAALLSDAPLTTAEMQSIHDAISQVAVSDDAAAAAAAAAIAADTPAAV